MTAKASSLARRSKPLSSILTTHYTCHAVADLPYYASSLAVNPSFSQLAGAKVVGSKRWGSVSFAEMEKLERLFRAQLEMTSKSLWLMSGILAMLKRDGFQPADPTLFNTALASASATLSQTARASAASSTFVRAKRRDSLLAHTEIPVPETQRHALTVSIRCWGYSLFYCIIILFANVFINFSAFCLFYLFYSMSLPKVSPGGFVHTVHVT